MLVVKEVYYGTQFGFLIVQFYLLESLINIKRENGEHFDSCRESSVISVASLFNKA